MDSSNRKYSYWQTFNIINKSEPLLDDTYLFCHNCGKSLHKYKDHSLYSTCVNCNSIMYGILIDHDN